MKASTEDGTRSFQHSASVHASAFSSYQLGIMFYSHFVYSEKYIGHSEKCQEKNPERNPEKVPAFINLPI